MLTNDKKGLRIFDFFTIDFELPKWQKRKQEGEKFTMFNDLGFRSDSVRGGSASNQSGFYDGFVQSGIAFSSTSSSGGLVTTTAMYYGEKKMNFFERFFRKNKIKQEADRIAK